VARPQRIGRRDWFLLGAAAALGFGAIALGVALGSWRFLFG
jgi:hypothetical protein